MKFSFKQFIVPNFWKRLMFMLPAIFGMGIFLSILIEIGWGTIPPSTFMNLNISSALHLSLGTTQVIVYSLFFIFTFAFGSDLIGFGTFANIFFIGYTIDFCRFLWAKCGLSDFLLQSPFFIKLPIFCITLFFFVVSAAIYLNSKMGVAPYDAIPKIVSRCLPKIPFMVIRVIFDFSAISIGLIASLFSGKIQGSLVGPVLISLMLGPIITMVGKKLSKIL